MDGLDRELVKQLRRDGRATFTDLAARLGTSEGTVRARLKRLVADGTIKQFTVRTGGADVRALVEVQVKANVDTGPVAAEIGGWDSVESVWEITGEDDLVIVADCPSTDALNDLIDRIRGVSGTAATRSRLILKEH